MKTIDSLRTLVAQVGRQRLRFLGSITLAHTVIHWFMQLLPVLGPVFKSSMGLNDVQVGILASMRMFVQAALTSRRECLRTSGFTGAGSS